MQRIISLAATAGLLTIGLAACGTSNDNAGATSPSPAVKAGPDKESCSQAKALALAAGLRMAGVSLNLEIKTQADAAKALDDVVEQAAQAKAKVTDPQVKAIVDEYQAAIDQLKKQLATPGADATKLLADVDVAVDKFEKAEQKLSTICVEATPGPTASGGPRAAACAKIEKATLELVGPMTEIGMAGTDRAKLEAAIKKVLTALDAYAAELTKTSGEATDAEFKSAITTAAADVQKMKQAIVGAGTDAKKLEQLLNDDSFGASQKKLQTLCGS